MTNNVMMNLFGESSASFSDDRKYRYVLCRIWSDLPKIMYIGLNPSTANESKDDPTIRRLKKFTFDLGYGGFVILNLFAYITAYPAQLKTCINPVMDNDLYLEYYRERSEKVIFCWGNFDVFGRDKEVIKMFPNAYCFGKNKNGTPKHPLYLKSNTKIEIF